MNRKLVNGLLLLSVATVGCGTFTSCKDTDEDFKNEIILDQTQLRADLIRLIEENRCKCDPDLAEALLQFAKANGWSDSQHNFATVMASWLASQIGQDNLTYLNGNPASIKKIATDLTNLSNAVKNDTTALRNSINDLDARIDSLENKKFEQVDTTSLSKRIENLKAEVAANKKELARLDSVDSVMSADLTRVSNLATANKVSIDSLAAITAKLEPLINANSDRLNKLITGIITQQTYNPLFGTLNLPIGLQSNIVANYYGYTVNDIVFPFGGNDYNGDSSVVNDENTPGIAEAIDNLGFDPDIIYKGYYMDDVANNLGNLYVTINPNNINFEGIKGLSLVNSKDEKAPVELTTYKENDKVLDFGFDLTRSTENNGFYRSEVKVDPENAPVLAVRIESGLKSAMKDALLDHTKEDFVALGKILFNQMNGILPAYALKAEWEAPANVADADGNYTTETKTFAVYSNYNIAAATVHPLGYEFLYGEGTSKELPPFGRLTDKLHEFFNDIKNDITFTFGLGIDKDKYKINLDLSNVKFEIGEVKVRVDIPALEIIEDGVVKGHTEPTYIILGYDKDKVYVEGDNDNALKNLVESIQNAVNNMISDTTDPNSLQSIIEREVTDKLNDLIDDLNGQLSEVDGKVESQFKDIIDKIENQLAGKLDGVQGLVDKYNALANKINNFLKNPNNYLQVMMAYSTGNGDLHHLSTTYNDPTRFVKGSGDAITLYATSYTAELVAPSFKKFVAVTRAWKNGVEDKTEPATINKANQFFNEVRPGRQQQFGMTGLKSGYKYEIVYTSLDYRGFTSTRLYYLEVK